jgi:proton-translocating NADH-quinone oxidoreductase chain L
MYILVLLLPLMSAISIGLLGNGLGRKGASLLASTLMVLTFFISINIFYEVAILGCKVNIKLIDWFVSGTLVSGWGFLFDTVTSVMLVIVVGISTLVHIYSIGYMSEDPHLVRFVGYLSLFTFFMLCLVTADNLLQMFLGWEGVGLASYLLINFWYSRVQANKAALKAIIVNRFGDFGISIAIMLLYVKYRTLNLNGIFALLYAVNDGEVLLLGNSVSSIKLISILLFLGAIGKSAQLGLHTWLPDAMEGPTPVSALIHAATMVTAGVFVLVRCSPIFEHSGEVLLLVTLMGALTAFFAGTVGVFQNDLKRVIAYSTCSQLGYMVFVCGLSGYSVSMFHLMNHAFFKALLFLSAGCIIHGLQDEQDMRRMGGLVKVMPITYVTFFIGSLALMGFPYTTGYYSKELILEIAKVTYNISGIFAYNLGVLGAMCTAIYSTRLLYLTFFGETNMKRIVSLGVHEGNWFMVIPSVILCAGSIYIGYVFKDMFIGGGTPFWNNAIVYENYEHIGELEAEYLTVSEKLIPFVLSMLGICLTLLLQKRYNAILLSTVRNNNFRMIYNFYNKKWYFDLIYNNYVVQQVLNVGYRVTYKVLDRGLLEIWGPTGIVRIFKEILYKINKLHTGYLYHNLYLMVVGILVVFGLVGIIGSLLTGIGGSQLFITLYCVTYMLYKTYN